MKAVKNTENAPELLSKVVDTIPLSDNNILLNLLVESVAIIPLNTIKFGRLYIAALQYLLSCTHEKKILLQPKNMEFFVIVLFWQQNEFLMMHIRL